MGLLQEKLAKYDLPQKFMAQGVYPYFREIEGKQGTEVEMGGHEVLMFGSNAYTGLTGDERVIEAGINAMHKYGSGCAGSRFLNGTLDLHVQLEKELAAFVGKDEALCFSTGFTVNSGVIPALTDRNDYIICDDRDHASIVDGRRLSFSQQLKYKHNDMADLEKQLQKCNPDSVKLIIVDGVFSMEGDLANLPEIVRLKHKYNATIMVDEAHGLGVFGKQGRGVCDHFGLTHEVDLIMGTFSKSLASIGGFIAADSSIINWLRHNARTYIFSASNTPAATASALEALHIIQNEPERLEALWEATNYALKRFREAGFEIGATESPIIPLYVYIDDINGWLYHRIRMCIWKQWKLPRTKKRNLIKMGVHEYYANMAANCRRGHWYCANLTTVKKAMTKERLINSGFYDLATAYQSVHVNY